MVVKLSSLCTLWGDPLCFTSQSYDVPIGPISTDSRRFTKGSFFVPLVGNQYDGHEFLEQVLALGAQGAVVSKHKEHCVPKGLLYWIVEDTLFAYQQLALLHRRDLNIPVVAVTGSNGKTTTKELIKASLMSLGPIHSSIGNNNNDIGVPFTILQCKSKCKAMIIEMAMRGVGEIKRLSDLTEPSLAVITNIGNAHIGRLGSRSKIAFAKCEITSSLCSSGVVVIPAGDLLLEKALQKTWKGRVIRVGIEDEFTVKDSKSDDFNQLPPADIIGRLDLSKKVLFIEGIQYNLPLEGKHNALNLMLAIAIARELGVDNESLKEISIEMLPGRNSILKKGNLTVLDETYNSSPESVVAALDVLKRQSGRHFAVLGTMQELGDKSIDLHCEVARKLAKVGLDGLILVCDGPEAKAMEKILDVIPKVSIVSTPEEASLVLQSWLEAGDVLLLKASRGIALDRILPLLPKL